MRPMGVTVQTGELAIEEILAYARLAEELGYDGFLPTEESGKDAMLGAAGFAEEVRAIAAAWHARQQQRAVELVSKELLEAASLTGGRDKIRQHLRAYLDQGVYPIIYPATRPGHIAEDMARAIRLIADLAA